MMNFLPGTLVKVTSPGIWAYTQGFSRFIVSAPALLMVISDIQQEISWTNYVLVLCNGCPVEIPRIHLHTVI